MLLMLTWHHFSLELTKLNWYLGQISFQTRILVKTSDLQTIFIFRTEKNYPNQTTKNTLVELSKLKYEKKP